MSKTIDRCIGCDISMQAEAVCEICTKADQLTATLAEREAEVEGWKKKFEDAVVGIYNRNDKIRQLNEKNSSVQYRLEAQISTLRTALEEYGKHNSCCGYNMNFRDKPCDCGFEQALERGK